jgi:hypothetical protein
MLDTLRPPESRMLSPQDERDLVHELSRAVVGKTAPEELAVFDDAAADYFTDPQGFLRGGRDEPVGFGLEFALLTPYVLAIVRPVVKLLADLVADAVRDDATPALKGLVHRLLRRDGTPGTHATLEISIPLNTDQLRRIRDVAYTQARSLDLPEDRAALFADAVTGRLVVAT